jgi:hypothetical protein
MPERPEVLRAMVFIDGLPHNPASGEPNFRLLSCRRWQVIGEAMFERIRDDTDYTKPLRA